MRGPWRGSTSATAPQCPRRRTTSMPRLRPSSCGNGSSRRAPMLELDAEVLYRTLAARARETFAGAALKLVGVHTGGVWLAERLRQDLHIDTPVGILDVSFYRD